MSGCIGYRRFEVPRGVEAAARRLQAAAKADGLSSVVVHVCDGQLASMSLFDKDGRQHYVVPVKGGWHELLEVY